MAATVDTAIGEILGSMDLSDLNPNTLIASLVSADAQLSKSVSKAMDKAIKSSLKSVTNSFKLMENRAKKESKSKDFNLSMMLGQVEKDRKKNNEQYNQMVSKAMKGFGSAAQSNITASEKIDKLNIPTASEKIDKLNIPNVKAPAGEPGKEKSFFEEEKTTTVGMFTDKAMDQLKSVLGDKGDSGTGDDKEVKGKGLGAWAVAGGLILGGLYALYKGLTTDSQWVGTLKLIGKSMILAANKMMGKLLKPFIGMAKGIAKSVFGPLKKVFTGVMKAGKKLLLPVLRPIGTLLLKAGDKVAVFAKAMKGKIANLGKVLIKPFTTMFMKVKGGFTKVLGAFKGMFGKLLKPMGAIAGKGAGKSIFKTIAAKIGGVLAKFGPKFLKRIPGIGAIIGLAFAVKRAKQGDWMGALLELGSGVLSTIPGVGTALSIGLDAFIAFRDIKKAKEPKKEKTEKVSLMERIKEGVKGIGSKITGWVWSILPGPIKAFLKYDETTGKISLKGISDIKEGFIKRFGLPKSLSGQKKESDKALEASRGSITAAEAVESGDEEIMLAKSQQGKAKQKLAEFDNLPKSERKKQKEAHEQYTAALFAATKKLETLVAEKGAAKNKTSDVAQDFVARPGQPVQKFSSADTLIGAKEGGPIEKALTTLNNNFSNLAQTLIQQPQMQAQAQQPTAVINNNQTQAAPQPESTPLFKRPSATEMDRGLYWAQNRGFMYS